ncbi:DUF799 domain-containing protein [Campylobacter sp. 7477a]|uniref:DUF799 domain-containing protein n=1 Tax=Campylobacter sp. 7477a TaxID=2735741 RepID=UPI003014BADE|nr:DUF799 family lipoprotein [Campylobacter sp. 7477a]
MKFLNILFLAFIALFFSACAASKGYDYSNFLQTKPRSILVPMPTNETAEIKASAAVLAHSLAPLSEAGYYVFSPALVNDTFKHNGITEPSEIAQIPLSKLKQIFNADAVLYLNVSQYGTSYQLINSKTAVAVEAKLVDINTANTLWERTVLAQQDSGGGSGGLLGILVSAVVNQIVNSVGDAGYDMSAQAMMILYAPDCYDCLLRGQYSAKYMQDKQLTR